MFKNQLIYRRRFLRDGVCLSAAPFILSSTALGNAYRAAPSERITVGLVGLGGRGFNLLEEFLAHSDVQVVAVCDVDSMHYRDNDWGKGRVYGRDSGRDTVERHYASDKSGTKRAGVAAYSDYRDLCEREDIDAVVVATPDHWHALCTLEALRQGKDVYCEKPVTHFFHEGQLVYREVAARKAVFQTGSQQRSETVFRQAVELVMNGHIGKVERFEVGLPPGYDQPMGDATVTEPPKQLDYNFWLGPAPLMAYSRARHHRWWRGHSALGGGVLMDWIGHHNDIAHWSLGLDDSGPSRVEAVNWKFPDTDVYDTPQQYEIRCEYPGGVTSSIASHHPIGTKWIGTDGWIYVMRGKITASNIEWTKTSFDRGPKKVFESPGHTRNFLECVKSRQTCVAPAETAHRSITPGHLGYVSHAVGRALKWDVGNEKIVGDDEADKLLRRTSYRKPWTLSST